MNNRMRLHYIAAMIVFILLSLPHHAFAQDLNQGDVLPNEAVGGILMSLHRIYGTMKVNRGKS